MQSIPSTISSAEERIIEMSTEKGAKEISQELAMPLHEVLEILSTPYASKKRESNLQIIQSEVQFKRLSKANGLIDRLMDGIEQIVSMDASKWKMSHVKLFELLLKDIPDQLKSLKSLNLQVNNNYAPVKSEVETEENLDNMMSYLPAEIKMKFWNEVEMLAKKYVDEYNGKKTIEAEIISEHSAVINGSVAR